MSLSNDQQPKSWHIVNKVSIIAVQVSVYILNTYWIKMHFEKFSYA